MISKKLISAFFLFCMLAGYIATVLPIIEEGERVSLLEHDPYDSEESEKEGEKEKEKEKEETEEKEEIEKNKELLGYQNLKDLLTLNERKGKASHKSYTAVFIDVFTPPPELSI